MGYEYDLENGWTIVLGLTINLNVSYDPENVR